jgi:uncharacterized surface protein with fasciclin (FAS1) repeats
MKNRLMIAMALTFASLLTRASPATTGATQATLSSSGVTLLEIIVSYPEFSMLYSAIETTGLTELLERGPHTLFAPTNDAFEALPAEELSALLANPQMLERLLLNHLVADLLDSSQLIEAGSITTLAGRVLAVRPASDGAIEIGTVIAIEAIVASNGVLYVVDTLLPLSETTTQRHDKGYLWRQVSA